MIKIRVVTRGSRRVETRISDRVRDLSPVLNPQAKKLQGVLRRNFATQRSPDGEPWAPHRPATVARRGPGATILVETGKLRRGVQARATRRSVRYFVTGPATKYAEYHMTGTDKMVARPFLPLTFAGGRARRWLTGLRRVMAEYIRAGKASG
jgi:phage gpG-like protein